MIKLISLPIGTKLDQIPTKMYLLNLSAYFMLHSRHQIGPNWAFGDLDIQGAYI